MRPGLVNELADNGGAIHSAWRHPARHWLRLSAPRATHWRLCPACQAFDEWTGLLVCVICLRLNLISARSNRPERNHWSGCIARFGRSNVGGQHFRALCGRPITLKNTIIKQPNPLVLHLHVIWWNGSSIFCSIIYSLLILLHSLHR